MSDDLIKRSDAIGAITNHCENECYYRGDNGCPQCQREEFQEAIKVIPSADRPQGEWIYVTVEEWLRTGRDYGHHCSECDEINKSGKSNFCPNCGVRMKGADDE